MTWDQYWYGDVWMVRAFLKAESMRKKREADEINRAAHLQGLYIYEAVGRLAPILHAFAKKGAKPKPYLKKPFDLGTDKDKPETDEDKEKREQAEALRAQAYMMNMFRAGQSWGKK